MTVNDVVEDGAVNILSRPILVPLDGSDVAAGILPYVVQVAGKANIPLVLLTAVDPDAIDYPASAMSAVPSSAGESMVIYRTQFEESSRVHAQDALHRVAARLRDDGIEVKATATIGGPAEEILRIAEKEGCGLIAMSTHGRNPIGRSILGSVTDRVIHASNVPVLAVTPERAKKYREEGSPPSSCPSTDPSLHNAHCPMLSGWPAFFQWRSCLPGRSERSTPPTPEPIWASGCPNSRRN